MAVPFRPQGRLVPSHVERIDDHASLPAVVVGRLGTEPWVGAVGKVTQPDSCRLDGVDIDRQGSTQAAPGDSRPETTCATRRASPAAIASRGFRSSSASIGFDNQTGM